MKPENSFAQELLLASRHYSAGSLKDAEAICRRVLTADPNHPDALNILGLIAHRTSHPDAAISLLKQAIAVFPKNADYLSNLGMILASQRRMDEGAMALQDALRLDPKHVDARNHLGNVYAIQGRFAEAIVEYNKALAINANLPATWENAGQVYLSLNHIPDAIKAFESAIKLRPNVASYYTRLSTSQKQRGDLPAAIAALHRGIAAKAVSPELYNGLGTLWIDQAHYDKAEQSLREALRLDPTFTPALINLGGLLRALSRLSEAEQFLNQAIRIDPQSAAAHNNLANVLRDLNRLDDAEKSLRRALQIDPSVTQAANNLGAVLKNQGRVEEAIGVFQDLVQRVPDFHDAWSNLLYTVHFDPRYDAAQILEQHLRWRRAVAEPLMSRAKPFANDRGPDRRLRIGYISPDFRDHVVGRNLVPLFQNHCHDHFEIICYSDVRRPDFLSEIFQTKADLFRNVAGLSNSGLADLIRQDQIDILIDLTLHMDRNRLLVFAEKPAPVQMTFAGYPSTTGLNVIDYRITDSLLDPPGMDEAVYAEALIRLPGSFWCFDPLGPTPEVNPLPALRNGFLTFGCLNNFSKVNDQVLALWGKALRNTPGSRMIIMCDSAKVSGHSLQVLETTAGQSLRSRVTFVGRQPRINYLAYFNQIDLALDSFPYNGHTTTLDGFWMGVPVISMQGKTSVGRAGAAQLTLLGLDQFIANGETAFLSIIHALNNNLENLAAIRSGLRDRMQRSVLTDGRQFAQDIESLYRQAWQKYCA